MPNLSLGTIEVLGLPAAVAAADVACKTADVTLIGYETTDGMGMVAVKIEGQVSAVQAAIAAARAEAGRITKVFATSVIPRPSTQLEPVVLTDVTVGLAKPAAPQPAAEAVPEPVTPEPAPAAPPEPASAAPVEPVAEPAVLEPAPEPEPAAEPAPEPPAPATAPKPAARRPAAKTRRTPKPNPSA